jgi:hypothetical protein
MPLALARICYVIVGILLGAVVTLCSIVLILATSS